MRKYGQLAADMIRLRTRLGSGVAYDGADKANLKPLSSKYIKQREDMNDSAEANVLTNRFREKRKSGSRKQVKLSVSKSERSKAGGLSELTSPKKSNLTRTGQLLDSIQVTNAGIATVSVGPKGGRDDGLTNQKVAEHVTEAGRPFNSLSKIETKRLHDEVKRNLREAIKRVLTNK